MTNKTHLFESQAACQRIAILGVGNELNGDDAAGILAARKLIEKTRGWETKPGSQSPLFYIAEAGMAPESFTGPLRRFQPNLVVLVDAAEIDQPPGTIACFDWTEAEGMSASTHTLPPTVLAQFLMREIGCRVMLIGIQPKTLAFDDGVSDEVLRAVQQVVEEFEAVFLGEDKN